MKQRWEVEVKTVKRYACVVFGLAMVGSLSASPLAVPEAEQRQWLDHLLPLPHEITIGRSVTLKSADVAVVVNTDAGPVHEQIHAELRALFQGDVAREPAKEGFQILFGVLDGNGQVQGHAVPGAARLQSCPNAEQAYLIRPDGDRCLIVAALHERGLYYGAQTLRQLLEARFTPDAITIPLATVTDWPDMEERGSWNSARVVPFLASLKLNFFTYTCGSTRQANGLPRPVVDPKSMALLRRHAMVQRVQMLHHLNYFDRLYGLYQLFPELKGQGDKAVCEGEHYKFANRDIPVICASQPRWKSILTEMLEALGEQRAPEVSVWLSEFTGQCQCAECLKSTQTQTESRLVTEAWQAARKKYPALGLRIFYSQGDATPATAQALAALPPEVKIERVYTVYKPFLDAAKQEKWVLSFSGYDCITTPDNCFQTPDAVRRPIADGHRAELKGVLSCSYPYYGNGVFPAAYYPGVYSFPLSALAEWSWNLSGRTPRQFTEAWATRAGYHQPERFADWVEAVTALKKSLAQPRAPGAGLPNTKGFKNPFADIVETIRDRKPLGLFATGELEKASSSCREALALADPLNKPEPLAETRYFGALVAMYQKLNLLSDAITGLDLSQPAQRATVQEAWLAYQASVAAALAANDKRIELWRAEPADYVETAQAEIHAQWQTVRKAMDEAIAAILKQAP
ncbi:MAG: hypothetical protein HUU20_03675 [Pirellulales bacterium]|nr:hypothetical protein [Pirellulales bacterium]